MAQNSALSRVMDQADEAAERFQPPVPSDNANLPAANSGGQALSKPTLDSMADSAGLTVDEYLTIKEGGFRLAEMKEYFKEMEVEIDMTEVVPIFSVRANTGGNTRFEKSYDGVTTAKGENFTNVINHLKASYSKVDGPYQTVEIPCTLLKDVTDGKVTVEAGTTIGITPSVTGAKEFAKFHKSLRAGNRTQDTLKVKVVHARRENSNGNEWGVATFSVLD